ncbi:MAG: glycosyltransferase [Bdellovibrionales bacterium]|nr:glycosyltransferase [Bdellovibrionales bacterium]
MTAETQKLALHQYHHSVGPADAVTRHMLLIRNALLELGIESQIFASEIHPALRGLVHRFPNRNIWNADLLLIQHSMGNPQLQKVLEIEVPKAIVFHNVTPPEFFHHDPYLRHLAKMGLSQLAQFRQKTVAAFAVSNFNVQALMEYGIKAELFPLLDLHQPLTTGTGTDERPRPRPQLLFVGKLCAHKNQALLLRTLTVLRGSPETEAAELTLIGGEDPIYGKYLKSLCRALKLESFVHFAGKVSDFELAANYLEADYFVSPSLHEGFCIPLVEAMRFGVPVIALKRGAVAETLGQSGVLLNGNSERELAHAIRFLQQHAHLREQIVERQNARIAELKRFQNKGKLSALLLDVLERTRQPKQSKKAFDERTSESNLQT